MRGRTIVLQAALGPLSVACLLLTAGCASYRPQPLALQANFTTTADLSRLTIDPAAMPLPALAAHRFDPSDGLDIDEVAMLAVANNPDLRLARDGLGIVHAQAFAAGLLPDPQISLSSDYPGQMGLSRAFSYGFGMDVMALVTRGADRKAASATVRKTDLALLWQEWQVVVQAKQLFVRARFQDAVLPLLDAQRKLARDRFDSIDHAVARHDANEDMSTAARLALADARTQDDAMHRMEIQTHHDLNLLLGLAPDVKVKLTGSDTVTPLPDDTLNAALAKLPRRRPDLIALEAGYAAQEQKLRAAVLNQFPNLQVGFNRSRDTSEIYSSGFQINFSLPVFNRNRGNIAIETATRQRLADEYVTRLKAARANIAHLRAETALSAAQLTRSETALPALDDAARQARDAYAAHEITLRQMTNAAAAALKCHIEAETQRDALAEQRIGLQAMLGAAIPDPDATASATDAAARTSLEAKPASASTASCVSSTCAPDNAIAPDARSPLFSR
ncbi:TolC family protein [Burkholderia glumae]